MTPLVLLPGLMCDARLFGPQIEAFSSDRQVWVPSFVGDTIGEIASHILADAPPKFALAGLSMGGIVAMEILRQEPARVARLALLDTNPMAEKPEVQAGREPQITKVQNGQLNTVMRDEMKPKYLAEGANRQAILDLCMEMAQSLGASIFVSQSRALQSRPDQRETLENSNIPTLILCGCHDTLCPISHHQLMHALMPHATLHIVEGAGHLPTLEQPADTTQALAYWLDEDQSG